jgi:hypothetical protein
MQVTRTAALRDFLTGNQWRISNPPEIMDEILSKVHCFICFLWPEKQHLPKNKSLTPTQAQTHPRPTREKEREKYAGHRRQHLRVPSTEKGYAPPFYGPLHITQRGRLFLAVGHDSFLRHPRYCHAMSKKEDGHQYQNYVNINAQ